RGRGAGGGPPPAAGPAGRAHHGAHRRRPPGDVAPRGRAGGGGRGQRGIRRRPGPPAEPGGLRPPGGRPVTSRAGPCLLAVDAGTGSCRAVLFAPSGEQVAASLREWAHREPPDAPGGQDFDVEANWAAITACIRDALSAAGATGGDIAAVAATSMREGIVLYDAGGAEIWACPNVDSRAADEAAERVGGGAAERIGEGAAERIFAEAGDWVSITSPARLRWLARHRPGIFASVRGLGMLSDWITYRLAGVQVTEPSCGSSSGMFSLASRTWSDQIAQLCGLAPAVLPPVADPGTVVG